MNEKGLYLVVSNKFFRWKRFLFLVLYKYLVCMNFVHHHDPPFGVYVVSSFFARTNFIATHASLCDFYSCVFSPLHEDLLNMWNFGREIYVHYTVSSSFVIQIQFQMKEIVFSCLSVFLWTIIVALPYWCNGYIYSLWIF